MSELHPWAGSRRDLGWTWRDECLQLLQEIRMHREDILGHVGHPETANWWLWRMVNEWDSDGIE